MPGLTLRNIKKTYGGLEILHGINLDIQAGEFVVFVGPSGCGKSTLLRTIAGLEDISSGEFHLDDVLMNHVPPSQRGIAMVFQSYALYPHMTVFDNMAFGMKIARVKKDEIARRVGQAAEILHLTPYLDRFPKALSGGQRQRVAIGRAIVRDPKVFLFDEPLSNLDAALRVATRIEIAKLKQSMPETTMIYVTHDQVEAMTLADRIVVLRDGRIEQVGSPIALYRRPVNLFVAGFIGSPAMNVVQGVVVATGAITRVKLPNGAVFAVPIPTPATASDTTVHFGVRPEDLRVADAADAIFEGVISLIEQLGEVQLVYLDLPDSDAPIVAKLPGTADLRPGQRMRLTASPENIHLFDMEQQSIKAPL